MRVLSVEGGVSDVVWEHVSRSSETFAIAGIVKDLSRPLRVTLVGADGKRFESDVVQGFGDAQRSEHVPFIWASMRIERLEEEYGLNRGEIRRLGKAFNVAIAVPGH